LFDIVGNSTASLFIFISNSIGNTSFFYRRTKTARGKDINYIYLPSAEVVDREKNKRHTLI
jgi:hypothetical protein